MNRREIGKIVLSCLAALVGGFTMLFATYAGIGEKALRLPGGALFFGLVVGFMLYRGPAKILVGVASVALALTGHFLAVSIMR